jgi:uracil-DNA glycosylase family 4
VAGGDADDPRAQALTLATRIRTRLEHDERRGALGLPRGKNPRLRPAKAAAAVVAVMAPASPTSSPAKPLPRSAAGAAVPPMPVFPAPAAAPAGTVVGAAGLKVIREQLGECQRCKLAGGRQNIVFGVGNPQAQLVFVGEAPGADEDQQGEPFVGKAGQLLNKMIEAMGYARADVYICNVIKCRPPGNRNPEPDEVSKCEPFLKQQLAAIRPRMIVTLGKFAAQCLLRDETPISRLRGNFRTYEGIPLMPTFHPAYLLRDPSKKKETWTDLKEVNAALKRMGIDPPRPPAG